MGVSATSPEGLEKIRAVHEAVAKIPGVESPLSLWSLVIWLGGSADEATSARLTADLDQLSPAARSRFLGQDGKATLVSASLEETPTYVTLPLISEIEQAARAAGGPDVIVTGVTVVTARESTRTIDNLNVSLTFAILGDLAIMILAFRMFWVGFLAVLSNTMPVLATCAILFLMGRGMQLNTVIALIVAFGVTVDETTHYLNHFIHHGRSRSLGDRLIETTRQVGPVLISTTVIILCGLATTLTSGLPTVTLFGVITAMTLLFALVGDLLFLPALIAGPTRRWFEQKKPVPETGGKDAPSDGGARARATGTGALISAILFVFQTNRPEQVRTGVTLPPVARCPISGASQPRGIAGVARTMSKPRRIASTRHPERERPAEA